MKEISSKISNINFYYSHLCVYWRSDGVLSDRFYAKLCTNAPAKLLKAHLHPVPETKASIVAQVRKHSFLLIVLNWLRVSSKLTCSFSWESPRGNKSMQNLFCPHHVQISWLGTMNTECGLWNTKCGMHNSPLLAARQGEGSQKIQLAFFITPSDTTFLHRPARHCSGMRF